MKTLKQCFAVHFTCFAYFTIKFEDFVQIEESVFSRTKGRQFPFLEGLINLLKNCSLHNRLRYDKCLSSNY